MNYRRTLLYAVALASALTHDSVLAVSNATYTVEPPGLLSQTEPLVMISLSRDHQLFQPAYNSYTDLDGDGLAEHTYNNSINYVGYFDFDKCYQYSSAAQRFIPNSFAPVDPNDTTRSTHYCDGQGNNLWSGNFLNWATMTRADVIRKVLYGGYRSTDTTSLTVLERSFLPKDAHSFARHYEGADVKKLVPSNFSIDLRGNDHPNHGITLCNTTPTSNGLPTIRVAAGNFGLWASGPQQQCRWQEETVISNGNDPDISGFDAQPLNPAKNQACVALRPNGTCRRYVDSQALGAKDYVSRVTVCSDAGLLAENCSEYSVGEFTTYKPIGLLQRFGEPDLIKFGLITGSYAKNKSGGVLRKGMSSLNSEINTDGTFDKSGDSIINSIDLLKLVEYDYETSVYSDCTSPGISSFSDGQCKNWGNPQSEIFLEAIRYLAGESSATSDYSAVDTGIIPGLTTATWNASTHTDYRKSVC